MKKKVTIAGVQARASTDVAANLAKAVQLVRQAARKGAKIICLEELYRTIYFPQHRKHPSAALAESIPGESTTAFSKLAKELGVVIIVPVFEKAPGGKRYNSAVVIDDRGRLLPTYRKMHIPQDPLFYEKNYFAPGNRGWRGCKTKSATFAGLA